MSYLYFELQTDGQADKQMDKHSQIHGAIPST